MRHLRLVRKPAACTPYEGGLRTCERGPVRAA